MTDLQNLRKVAEELRGGCRTLETGTNLHGFISYIVDEDATDKLLDTAADAIESLLARVEQLGQERDEARTHRLKDEDWPLAIQRLHHTEPGPDQGVAVVGCDDLAFALQRLSQFANAAMGNAALVGELEAQVSTLQAEKERLEEALRGTVQAIEATDHRYRTNLEEAALRVARAALSPPLHEGNKEVRSLAPGLTGGSPPYANHEGVEATASGRVEMTEAEARAAGLWIEPSPEALARAKAIEEATQSVIGNADICTLEELDQIRARLKSSVSPPEGGAASPWVLVPREPTEEMVWAGFYADPGGRTEDGDVERAVYRAMLAAAPASPEGGA